MAVEEAFKEALINALRGQNSPLIVLLVIVGVILSGWLNHGFARLYEPFEFWAKRRREGMDAYFAQNLPANDVQEAMRDLRDAHYFQIATGIYAEDKIRKRLIKLHQKTSPDITWRRIKRAMEYLEPDSGDAMRVKHFTGTDKFGWGVNLFAIALFLVGAALGVAFMILQPGKTDQQLIGQTVGILMFIFGATFMHIQNWPYYSAVKIREELVTRGPTP